jgi:flavin-dependent dehydrogenase
MDTAYDVVVVGAGPAGLRLGQRLAAAGHSVAILEARPGFDHASRWLVVSRQALQELGLDTSAFKPCRGHIMYSLEAFHRFDDPEPRSFFAERRVLQSALAQSLGRAQLHHNHRVKAIQPEGERVLLQVQTPAGPAEVRAKIVAACDGVRSISNKALGVGPGAVMITEHLFQGVKANEGFVEEVHTHRYSPGLYLCLNNLGPDTLTVCVASDQGNNHALLRSFAAEHPLGRQRGLLRASMTHVQGGPCPISKSTLVKGRVLFVGDSGAGFPWLGGITYGGALRAAEVAWGPIHEALETGEVNRLRGYEEAWGKAFREQYQREQALRSAHSRLSDEEIDQVFRASSSENLWQALLARAQEGR